MTTHSLTELGLSYSSSETNPKLRTTFSLLLLGFPHFCEVLINLEVVTPPLLFSPIWTIFLSLPGDFNCPFSELSCWTYLVNPALPFYLVMGTLDRWGSVEVGTGAGLWCKRRLLLFLNYSIEEKFWSILYLDKWLLLAIITDLLLSCNTYFTSSTPFFDF